jgi:hypothetical protein
MRFMVILFAILVMSKVQPTPLVWAGIVGGLLWAMVESVHVYRTMTDMKKLVSPSKVYTTIQGVVLRSMGTFVSRAILFHVVNQTLMVAYQPPLWSHLFGLSFGFYVTIALIVSYHRHRVLVK